MGGRTARGGGLALQVRDTWQPLGQPSPCTAETSFSLLTVVFSQANEIDALKPIV